jgi:hypothetical protein
MSHVADSQSGVADDGRREGIHREKTHLLPSVAGEA